MAHSFTEPLQLITKRSSHFGLRSTSRGRFLEQKRIYRCAARNFIRNWQLPSIRLRELIRSHAIQTESPLLRSANRGETGAASI